MHYNIVTAGEERIRLTFATPLDVLYQSQAYGGDSCLPAGIGPKVILQEFCDKYAKLFSCGNAVTLTYHPLYIIARKKP